MKRYGKLSYKDSYACPSVIGQRKEFVEILKNKLSSQIGIFEIAYTRNENGRDLILRCRRKAYITQNDKMIDKRQRVTNWE